MRHLSQRLAALVLPLIALAACQTVPPIELRSAAGPSRAFDQLNPSDIAILPIEDATPDRSLTPYSRRMRQQLADSLVERFYSPLGPEHVDRILAEAAKWPSPVVSVEQLAGVAGMFNEDAVLGLQVSRWDTSRVDHTDQVDFSAEVLLVGSQSKERLWSTRIEGGGRAGGAGPAPSAHDAKIQSAAEVLADAIARELPIRRLGTP